MKKDLKTMRLLEFLTLSPFYRIDLSGMASQVKHLPYKDLQPSLGGDQDHCASKTFIALV